MIINSDLFPVTESNPPIDSLDAIFSLCLNAKWLVAERYRDGLKAIVEDCSDQQQVKTVQYVLGKLRYCTSSDLLQGATEAADTILNAWQLTPENTIIVGVAEPNKPCGSTPYVRAIEIELPRGWKTSIYQTFVTAFRHRDGRQNLIIVDDFVGSGQKILDRIGRLRKNPKTSDYNIYIVAFAGMDKGLTLLADDVNNNLHAHIVMEACLSSAKPDELATTMRSSMKELEKKIFNSPGLLSLGYKMSEASFYLEGFNIPNNTFPFLWWDKYVTNEERPTLFSRR